MEIRSCERMNGCCTIFQERIILTVTLDGVNRGAAGPSPPSHFPSSPTLSGGFTDPPPPLPPFVNPYKNGDTTGAGSVHSWISVHSTDNPASDLDFQ